MTHRPPVVAILGHVDHGKTTLLDYIRKSSITQKESGGITQKIGGYVAQTGIKGYNTSAITFIDTPGHEAFSQLRARGAQVADIAILIIDAKDSLMPQTIESISHIKQAGIPYVVALNKSDLPDARPDKVKNDLLKHEVIVEGKGGEIPCVSISAKNGEGVKELLETILFIAAEKKLSYEEQNPLMAYIIETKKDRRGISVSSVIKDGVLRVGDTVFADGVQARVRSLISDSGEHLKEVFPSTPFELLGFEKIPTVGSAITHTHEAPANTDAQKAPSASPTADPFNLQSFLKANAKPQKKLSIIIKADSQGSLEAICASLAKNIHIEIIMRSVGDIHKSDVFLAKTSKSIIIGFNVQANPEAKDVAKQEKVIIKQYSIIYELLEELDEVADLLQEKENKEKNLKGEAKIVATFTIEGERVFGTKITKGRIDLNDQLEIWRNAKQIGKSKLVSLRVRAKTVNEVKKDQECGMILSPALDIRIGDVVKCIL